MESHSSSPGPDAWDPVSARQSSAGRGVRNARADRTQLAGFARFVFRRVPALEALRSYSVPALRADLVAGLTVASVAVPQAMAYAIAAGVPASHGLYTAIVMTAVGALFA